MEAGSQQLAAFARRASGWRAFPTTIWDPVGNPPTTSTPCGIMDGMKHPAPDVPAVGPNTWNDPARIAAHRALSPKERLRLTIEASRAALRFAHGARRRGR